MKVEKIEGFGSIYGGEYDRIEIEGIGTVKGEIKEYRCYWSGLQY